MNQKHPLVWLVDSFTESVHLIDPYEEGFPFLYVNERFTDITGYGNEIIGNKKNFLEGADTDEETSRKLEEVIEFEQSATIEILNYRKDGTNFWREIYLKPLNEDQKELFAYMCMQHDITYKKTSDNLKEKQSPYSTIDIYSSMISFINPDGIIEKPKINSPSIKTIYSKVGQHARDFIVEEDKAKDFQCFRNAMKGNIENAQIRIINGNEETL